MLHRSNELDESGHLQPADRCIVAAQNKAVGEAAYLPLPLFRRLYLVPVEDRA